MTKKTNWQDPNAAQEAAKYDNPIPSRELILITLNQLGATQVNKSLSHGDLAEHFGIADIDQFDALGNRLRAMQRDGQLLGKGTPTHYRVLTEADTVIGTVAAHAKGFGFVVLDDMPDLFLPEVQLRSVFHGDTVRAIASKADHRGRMGGKVIDVVARQQNQFIGTLEQDEDGYVVELAAPNNHQPICVTDDNVSALGASVGSAVKVTVTDWPTPSELAAGELTDVLDEANPRELIIETTLLDFDIPHQFTQSELNEANKFGEPAAKDYKNRIDIRDLALVTIDGEDSRDFDDAVFAQKRPGGGFRLVVAIADVSHYVRVGSALDHEAYERGTSVYFPHHVVPMLPESLSNGLCSLNPQVDRLCMVADINLSRQGRVTGYQFYPSVMHSQARLTYNQVNAYFAGNQVGLINDNKAVKKSIDILHQLYQVLLVKRSERHAMDFDTVETYITFNDNGTIKQILPRSRGDAHKLIEECMLLANTCAAEFTLSQKLPVLYRNHEAPDANKTLKVKDYLKLFGLSFPEENPTQADYQRVIEATKDRPDSQTIHSMLLRSMMQAYYDPENLGHFGLAYDAYSHFTSPIRRYPDLMLHRAIKAQVTGKKQPMADFSLEDAGVQTSDTERRAEEASRSVESFLKCHYMQEHLGDDFKGIITSVTEFGLFVTLSELFVDGLVHISKLGDDFFVYDGEAQKLIGRDKGSTFALGDAVLIKVAGVNLEARQIDFELLQLLKKHRFATETNLTTDDQTVNSSHNSTAKQVDEQSLAKKTKPQKVKAKVKTKGKNKANKADKVKKSKKVNKKSTKKPHKKSKTKK